jgi:hypothetical protein
MTMRGTTRPRDGGGEIRRWMTDQYSYRSTNCSSRLRSLPMSEQGDMGIYATIAERHMARWCPSAYAAIPAADRTRWFRRLDEEVTNAIEERERSLRPKAELQKTNFTEYVGQMRMAHLMAEEEVLAAMVYLPPEPGLESEADEPMTDETGAFVDPGWKPDRLATLSDLDWAYQQGLSPVSEEDVAYEEERRAERGQVTEQQTE